MKYFAVFNEAGERITSYAADGMPYSEADIVEKYPEAVAISAQDQDLYTTGQYMRDNITGKPVEKVAAVSEDNEEKPWWQRLFG